MTILTMAQTPKNNKPFKIEIPSEEELNLLFSQDDSALDSDDDDQIFSLKPLKENANNYSNSSLRNDFKLKLKHETPLHSFTKHWKTISIAASILLFIGFSFVLSKDFKVSKEVAKNSKLSKDFNLDEKATASLSNLSLDNSMNDLLESNIIPVFGCSTLLVGDTKSKAPCPFRRYNVQKSMASSGACSNIVGKCIDDESCFDSKDIKKHADKEFASAMTLIKNQNACPAIKVSKADVFNKRVIPVTSLSPSEALELEFIHQQEALCRPLTEVEKNQIFKRFKQDYDNINQYRNSNYNPDVSTVDFR